ncbi:MAG TPA: DegV family protein [Tissierellales bacterium]|nr:DegV family protein [Tissierellales bacterium]
MIKLNKIKIFTDSTSDLSKELIEQNNISIIPLHIHFNDEEYKDNVDLTQEELYKKVEEYNILPKTSAPSPQEFIEAFRPYIEKGYDIIYIGLSSKMSATIQNALIAKSEFPSANIEVVDSYNLSSGIGLLVMKACDFREQGLNLQEIAKELRKLVPKVRSSFIIDTLDYLHKGGRCSSVANFVGGILKIKPVVAVADGEMFLSHKIRGKRKKVIDTMLKESLKNKNKMDEKRVFITHSQGGDAVNYLKEELERSINVENIHITDAGCVISSHCGPGTVGILYIEK